MASLNPDPGGPDAASATALRARIAELEARIHSQVTEIEAIYALLGRERAERLHAEAALRHEQRLAAALVEHAPLGVQIFDRQGFSLRINEAQRALLGLPSRAYGVGHFNALSDPLQVASGGDELFRRAYVGEVIDRVEQTLDLGVAANTWQTDRRSIRYSQRLAPVFDEQGTVEAVIAFNTDLSELDATREALSTANQLIEGLFEYAPVALQIFDREGFSFRMNEVHRRLLGVPSREYGAGEFNALTDPFMVAQGHAAYYARAYAGEVVRMPTLTVDFTDAANTWGTSRRSTRIEQILFPILDQDGAVSAVVSCVLESAGGTTP